MHRMSGHFSGQIIFLACLCLALVKGAYHCPPGTTVQINNQQEQTDEECNHRSGIEGGDEECKPTDFCYPQGNWLFPSSVGVCCGPRTKKPAKDTCAAPGVPQKDAKGKNVICKRHADCAATHFCRMDRPYWKPNKGVCCPGKRPAEVCLWNPFTWGNRRRRDTDLEQCSKCYCYIRKDPSYTPYDGGWSLIVAPGTYLFTQIGNPGDVCLIYVTVTVGPEPGQDALFINKVNIYYSGDNIELNDDGTSNPQPNYSGNGYSVTEADGKRVVEFDECDASIVFSGKAKTAKLAASVSSELAPMGEGICGDCDGVRDGYHDAEGNNLWSHKNKFREYGDRFKLT